MSEFKGTKGSEDEKFSYAFNILYPNWDCRDIINQYEQNAVKGFHIGYNQALLDSKASEMLEMLKYIVNEVENGQFLDGEDLFDIKQLIKQATEL